MPAPTKPVAKPSPDEILPGSKVSVAGGPPMTVMFVINGHALCSWLEDENSPREADFSVGSLLVSK